MPFLDDTGMTDDPTRGPVAQAFAVFAGQVERLVAVNLLWAIQLVPAFCALAFPGLPLALRLVAAGWTVVVFIPACGALFALAGIAAGGENIGIAQTMDAVRGYALPALRGLGPLYGVVGVLVWAVLTALTHGPGWVVAPSGWLLLIAATLALYWGPAFAEDPQRSAYALLRISVAALWRAPARTAAVGAVTAVFAAVGVLSVGGLFLIVPAVVALVQTTLFRRGTRTWPTSVSVG